MTTKKFFFFNIEHPVFHVFLMVWTQSLHQDYTYMSE